MIEEHAEVVSIEGDEIWVETQRRSTCSSCAMQSGCGTSALEKVLGQRRTRVRVVSDQFLRVGDMVTIGVPESAFLRGTFAVYGVPLLLMLVFAGLGNHLAIATSQTADAGAMLFGLLGLGIGLAWVRFFGVSIRNNRRYQPSVLKRIS